MTSAAPFDVFLSYNHADAQSVREIRGRLAARSVRSFIDGDDLTVGKAWPAELERALQHSRAVAVFVGKSGYGRWQRREIDYSLILQAESNGRLSVIPVILEGADLPAGFLALNTWIDLRGGIDDASIDRLVRATEVSEHATLPPSDISPYRRLEAFREEDAMLFFGRRHAIDSVVSRIDEATVPGNRPRLVTVTGPSGSGKSSVVHAGVLPRLRSRRPPGLVWDTVVLQPRKSPWHSLANALLPLLEPAMSEVERIAASRTLADILRSPAGILSTIERILEKSRGTDWLLVVVDQFEELFTLTEDGEAREFVRALLAASRNGSLCILATIRSDYYGKAIALDRDLSDALPVGQVNLGPMRRDELREAIVQPANIVGLTFDPALVDRILDDVGDEPGNLPLLEYALSELWDLRAHGRLTLMAYQQIGGVQGALTGRAEAIYGELSEGQKTAARKLLLHLVRLSPADEEGADTRRRVRRGDIADEDWKLVQTFAGKRARLVVTGHDPASGGEGVEVAHEALIRRWERLRGWLNADREFLLWRQDLAIYRAGSPEAIPEGALLATASKWLRERRNDLSAADRDYIERSMRVVARTRTLRNFGIAAVVLVVISMTVWFSYTRTDAYGLRAILGQNPEAHIPKFETADGPEYDNNVARMVTLLRLGRLDHIRHRIAALPPWERVGQLEKLALALHAVSPDRAGAVLKEAIAETKVFSWRPSAEAAALARIARAAVRLGDQQTAIELLQVPDAIPGENVWSRREVAKAWKSAGRPETARGVLRAVLDLPANDDNISDLDRAVEELVQLGETNVASKVPLYGGDDVRLHAFYELVRVRAYAAAGNMGEAEKIARRLPKEFRNRAMSTIARLDFERHRDLSRVTAAIRTEESGGEYSELLVAVVRYLVQQKRDREVEQVIAEVSPNYDARAITRILFVQQLIDAGRLDDAARAAEPLKSDDPERVDERRPLAFARLGAAFAHAGRRTEAENALRYAVSRLPVLLNESERDRINAIRATAEARLGRLREARSIADDIEADDRQWEAYFDILDVYATQMKRR